MPDASLNLIITLTDKASKQMASLRGEVFGSTEKAMKSLTTAADKNAAAIEKNNARLRSMVAVAAAVGGAIVGVGKAMMVMVNETVAYADQVRDLSRNLGITTEEASKLIQVSDDLFVSVETIKTGMRTALKDGIVPSIDGLIEMAKEYQAIRDPAEKAAYAMDKFGRAGLEMTKILEVSPGKLREMSDALDGSALVMSQDAVDAAKRYKEELDTLADSWQALKTLIGNGVIPILIKVTTEVNGFIDQNNRYQAALKKVTAMEKADIITKEQARKITKELSKSIIGVGNSTEGLAVIEEEIIRINKEYITSMFPGLAGALELAGSAAVKASGDAGMGAFNRSLEVAAAAADVLIAKDLELAQAQDELNTRMGILAAAVSGPIRNEIESYTGKMDELKAKHAEVSAKIDELNGKKYLTGAQKDELAELQSELGIVSGDITKTADAHDEATKRILYNLLVQRTELTKGTLEQEKAEADMLLQVAKDWGLIDESTYNFILKTDERLVALAGGEGFASVAAQIENFGMLSSSVAGIYEIKFVVSSSGSFPVAPSSAQVASGNQWGPATTTSNPSSNWMQSAGYVPQHARGADYVVPAGFGGERWNVGTASSGERVTITPKGGTDNSDVVAAIAGLQAALPRAMRDAMIKAQAVA